MTLPEIVRACFSCYETGDRESLEKLIAEDFRFNSPLDDSIDRATYFERCWPNHHHSKRFTILKLFERGDEAFVTYECERTDGTRFRNTEFFQARDGKLCQVDVYFGPDERKSGE